MNMEIRYKLCICVKKGGKIVVDITKRQLYITYFLRAVESRLPRRLIPMSVPHHRDSLVYVVSGSARFILDDGRQWCSRAGDVIYLAFGQDYSLEVLADRYEYIVCDFRFGTKDPRFGQNFVLKNPPHTERLFRKLVSSHAVAAPDRLPRCMALLYQIYSLLIQNQREQYVPGSTKMRIEAAKVSIETNISNPNLSVASLAREAHMSEVHFRKLFSDLYTISPTKYITQERIAYACTLMALRELRLEDIALQSGFSSLPYFCKVFKATTGTTPAAYRQNLPDR